MSDVFTRQQVIAVLLAVEDQENVNVWPNHFVMFRRFENKRALFSVKVELKEVGVGKNDEILCRELILVLKDEGAYGQDIVLGEHGDRFMPTTEGVEAAVEAYRSLCERAQAALDTVAEKNKEAIARHRDADIWVHDAAEELEKAKKEERKLRRRARKVPLQVHKEIVAAMNLELFKKKARLPE